MLFTSLVYVLNIHVKNVKECLSCVIVEVRVVFRKTVFSKDYPHPDDHTRQTFDTPGFKPFTMLDNVDKCICFECAYACDTNFVLNKFNLDVNRITSPTITLRMVHSFHVANAILFK